MGLNCEKINLKKGSRGTDVTLIQQQLKKTGEYTGVINTYFGNYTKKAVTKFQAKYNLKKDGIFGKETCKKFREVYNLNTTDSDTTITNNIETGIARVPATTITANVVIQDYLVDVPKEDEEEETTEEVADETEDESETDSEDETDSETKTATPPANTEPRSRFKKTKQKLKKYTIPPSRIVSVTTSHDAEGVSDESTIKIQYDMDVLLNMQRTQGIILILINQLNQQIDYLDGYITDIKISQEDTQFFIEISVVGYTAFLEQSITYNATDKRSKLIKDICNIIGLEAEIDTTGLTDDTYTLSSTTTTAASEDSGSGDSSNDSSKRAEIFKKAATWKYQGGGGGSSGDPEVAYKWTEAHKQCDCFGSSSSLFYQFKTFTSIPVRIVVCPSSHASSGTHRTIQLKVNGEWTDPEEYSSMTRNLRVIKSAKKTVWNNMTTEQ